MDPARTHGLYPAAPAGYGDPAQVNLGTPAGMPNQGQQENKNLERSLNILQNRFEYFFIFWLIVLYIPLVSVVFTAPGSGYAYLYWILIMGSKKYRIRILITDIFKLFIRILTNCLQS